MAKKTITGWGILAALFLVMAFLQLAGFVLFIVRFKTIMVLNLLLGLIFSGLTFFFYKKTK